MDLADAFDAVLTNAFAHGGGQAGKQVGVERGEDLGLLAGFVFFVVDAFLVGMGEAGLLPPMVAAWSAPVICALIGLTMAAHQEVR